MFEKKYKEYCNISLQKKDRYNKDKKLQDG